ncbi:reverse transcriptase domain-containing protein, partial [Tanacetum coccineum]
LSKNEKTSLLQVLERRKGAIAWKMSNIKGISPSYCTHKILMEDDYKPVIQPQRRLNPKVQDVVKNEIVKLLDSGIIYPISDITGWRVCIDYRKLNDATRKDHFPLPFIDQMLECLCENEYYYFLDGFLGFFQIPIAPEDQEKTTFTCPYGTFAYRRMPFGLCNAPANFQRCMTAIFHDMVEDFMKVFMDDFSVFGNSFDCCLANLDRMLARCEETNLVLNWEKCHFMVKEGIVLGHKISGARIEVDRAKIDVIAKLPYPTNVKGVRSFLGHAGFYRRFIKDFSMISKPMTQLLMKDAKFDFSDDCKKAFNILKEKLTTAPIIISPDWNEPFELMCDARFDIEIKDKKGAENLAAYHLSRLENLDLGTFVEEEITDEFPDEHLMILKADLNNDEPCIFKDAKDYVMKCDACQRSGNISSRSKMPQNNIQTEVTNKAIKRILERSVGYNPKNWSEKLDDALWAFRTTYKTPTECTPFRLVYRKACHLPVKIEHKAYWALKQCNMDLTAAAKKRFVELNELMELRDEAYENTRIYKEQTKKWHDSRLRGDKNFKEGDRPREGNIDEYWWRIYKSGNLEVLES